MTSGDAESFDDGDGDGDYGEEEEEFEPPAVRREFKGPHIVVTGGQGFVGSHTTLRLLEEGYVVTVIDSGANSHSDAISRVRELVTEEQASQLFSHTLDLCDVVSLKATFSAIISIKRIDACVHLAALNPTGNPDKSTRESTRYHQNNVVGTMNLLSVLALHGCRKVVFSSSAMVYGDKPAPSPLNESDTQMGQKQTNPYARGKTFVEGIMQDMCASPVDGRAWGMIALRYYNAVGAHPSGKIGEDSTICPASNLMRELLQVMLGKRPELVINGDNYDTPDGTCVRDYVHVMDLAEGHLCAIKKLAATRGYHCYNLGTQEGVSDLKLVDAMEKASGLKIMTKVGKRRVGDCATSFVNPDLAWTELEWLASREITEICKDSWRWTRQNPDGYVGRDLKQTFGQFKAPSFKKSSMPTLSSAGREKPKRKKDKGVAALEGLQRLDTMDEYEAAMGAAF
jgi:UDP-glucose 4-epimerase